MIKYTFWRTSCGSLVPGAFVVGEGNAELTQPVSEGIAKLWQAAPELVSALENALDYIDGDEGPTARDLRQHITAALTKAGLWDTVNSI